VAQNIVAATEELNEFPEIGRIVPEIGDTNVRELVTTQVQSSGVHGSRLESDED